MLIATSLNRGQSSSFGLDAPNVLGRDPGFLKDISSASPQSRKRVHQWSLSHWTRQHQCRYVFAMPFVQSSLASFPTDFFCRILTTKFYLVTKKLSRPYEMGILLGWRWIQLLPWNATWSIETVPIPAFVKHKTEDTLHQILNIALTTTYLIGYASTGASAFWAGIWRHRKNTSRWNGTSSSCKRQSSTSSTNTWQVISMWRITLDAQFLLNKDTFHPDIKVSSIYLHDTRNGRHHIVNEGQPGWVLQAVTSRASFRRPPRNGKSFFTMMSQHINNHFAKKRCIGKKLILTVRTVMLQEHVDMVAGDFNGSAWRRSGSDPRPISKIEEAFTKTSLPIPPLWRPGSVPGEWADVCGCLKPPRSEHRMASPDAWSLHHPMWHAGAKREGSKLPSQSLGTSFSRECPSRWTCAAVQSGPAVTPERKTFAMWPQHRERTYWKESDHSLM